MLTRSETVRTLLKVAPPYLLWTEILLHPRRAAPPRPDGVSALYAALLGLTSLFSPDAHTPILLASIPTVRKDEELWGNHEAEGFGGLEIDD
jgi:hypothetical protein